MRLKSGRFYVTVRAPQAFGWPLKSEGVVQTVLGAKSLAMKSAALILATVIFCVTEGVCMDASVVSAGGFDVIGISVRTSNRVEMSGGGKIPKLWGEFYTGGIIGQIPNKANDAIIVLYYDYESDKDGEYSYLIGARVNSTAEVPKGMSVRHVPAGNFALFTTDRGPVAEVVQKGWQQIWSVPKNQPGGDRAYKVDYEVYDARSRDPQSSQVDIYIGIN
jgi:predicted transcriptional regulator YdeE